MAVWTYSQPSNLSSALISSIAQVFYNVNYVNINYSVKNSTDVYIIDVVENLS